MSFPDRPIWTLSRFRRIYFPSSFYDFALYSGDRSWISLNTALVHLLMWTLWTHLIYTVEARLSTEW